MSACLFMQRVDNLTVEQLLSLKRSLIKRLAIDPDPTNRFQCDKWAGEEDTLGAVYLELAKRYDEPNAS